jgi:hypothetical protein
LIGFDPAQAAVLRLLRYGNASPELIQNPFWELMILQRRNGYWARKLFDFKTDWASQKRVAGTSAWRDVAEGPVYCFTRFGRTVTHLADGRLVYVGGEHEDWYDEDFCVYNDVVVEHTSGEIEIYLYPRDTFPPTDFHTATLVGSEIYLIGSLGYVNLRQVGETPVYVLDSDRLSMRPMPTEGNGPGWISRHAAEYDRSQHAIRIWGGDVAVEERTLEPNNKAFLLDLKTGIWRPADTGDLP